MAWILGAEEQLEKDDGFVHENLETIQQLFYHLERFTTESSEKQSKIKDILNEGQMLILSSFCNHEERKEIQLQRNLLSQRWEDLRLKIMDKQSQLHHTLMDLQKKQLEEFRVWLTIAEDKISRFSEIGPDLAAIRQQYQEHMVFQEEVKNHEGIVKSLSNIIIIIDECENPTFSNENISDELVDQLEALAEKWRHVCLFVEERGNLLEYILNIWKMLDEQEGKFNSWIVKILKRLKEIEDALVDLNPRSKFVDTLMKRLDKMEADVNAQLMYYSEILNKGKHLLEKIDERSLAAIEIRRKIDLLSSQWDLIMERMNKIGHSIRQLTQLHREPSVGASQDNGSDGGSYSHIIPSDSLRPDISDDQLTEGSSHKKRKLDSWKLKEWQKALDTFVVWLERCESALGVHSDDHDSIFDQLEVKEQKVLLDDTENEVDANSNELNELVSRGREIVEELGRVNEDPEAVVTIIDTIEARWCKLKSDLEQKQQKVAAFISLMRLQSEADAMRRVLSLHEKWLDNEKCQLQARMQQPKNEHPNQTDLKKTKEQCKLRAKSMHSQEDRVKLMQIQCDHICDQFRHLHDEKLTRDLKQFLAYWNETKEKIEQFQQQLDQLIRSNIVVRRKEEELADKQPKLLHAIELFENWLIKAHETCALAALQLHFDAENYQEQINQFKAFEVDIHAEHSNFECIKQTADKIIEQNQTDSWVPALKSKIRSLDEKWNEMMIGLQCKVRRLESLHKLLPKLEEDFVSFDIWSEEANSFLKESIQFGDLEVMRAQSQQYDALIVDIEGPVMSSLTSIKDAFGDISEIVDADRCKLEELLTEVSDSHERLTKMSDAYEAFKLDLKTRINRIIESWNEIREVARDKKHLLQESIRECEKIIEKIDQFDAEIDKILREVFACRLETLDKHLNDLQDILNKLNKNLRSCHKMKSNLQAINGSGNFNAATCLEEIVTKIQSVEHKCSDLIERIEKVLLHQNDIKSVADDFRRICQERRDRLDQLDKVLSAQALIDPADLEEISEQRDHLENSVERCAPNEQAQEFIQQLDRFGLSITSDWSELNDHWNQLQQKYQDRHDDLEQHLVDATRCEEQLFSFQKELESFVNSLGRENEGQFVDNFNETNQVKQDVEELDKNVAGAEQTASDYNESKFIELADKLNELDEEICRIRSKGRVRSGERYTDQVKVLRRRLECIEQSYAVSFLEKAHHQAEQQQQQSTQNTEPSQLNDVNSYSDAISNHVDGSMMMVDEAPALQDIYGNQYVDPYSDSFVHSSQYPHEPHPHSHQHPLSNHPASIEIALEHYEHYGDLRFLFRDSVDPPWERALTNNHVPYFLNHETKSSCWDHPNFLLIQSDLLEHNKICYAAYRTSIKLRTLQQNLFLNSIHISNLIRILDSFDFLHDSLVSIPEMIACLRRIYEDISAKVTPITNMGLLIDLTLNWSLNMFDPDRHGFVDLLGFKITLVCLSRSSIEEKYKMLYQLIADSKGYADRPRVSLLLNHMMQIPKFLGEIASFGGSNLEPSIRSCFDASASGQNQIDVKHFLCWLKREPQCLVWLPLLHRLIISESSRHPVKCSVCKTYPLHGFRYKCLKCFNADLCQECFLLRRRLPGHKITHPVKEYCCATSANQDVSDFSQIVRNRFKSSRKSFRKHFTDSYLPVDNLFNTIENSQSEPEVSLLQYSPLSQNRDDMHQDMEFFANRLAQVELQTSATNQTNEGDVADTSTNGRFLPNQQSNTLNNSDAFKQTGPMSSENANPPSAVNVIRNSQIRKQNSLRLPNKATSHQPAIAMNDSR